MARGTLGIVAGLAVWVIVVTVAGAIMRAAWPAYANVADAMTCPTRDVDGFSEQVAGAVP